MSSPIGCGAEGTIIHAVFGRPIIGALICAGLIGGSLVMTGAPDSFGGCGETGGDLYRVTETPTESLVCANAEQAPVVLK
jgi:hypothetical protein